MKYRLIFLRIRNGETRSGAFALSINALVLIIETDMDNPWLSLTSILRCLKSDLQHGLLSESLILDEPRPSYRTAYLSVKAGVAAFLHSPCSDGADYITARVNGQAEAKHNLPVEPWPPHDISRLDTAKRGAV